MGDADVAHNVSMTNDDLETLVDEALTEVDEEMDVLFSLINILLLRTYMMMSMISTWEKFLMCFKAFNLFIIPIILSIGITYISAGWVVSGSTLQTRLEMIVQISMYVSCSFGLPLYIFNVWEMFFAKDKDLHLRRKGANSASDNYNENLIRTFVPNLDAIEEALETISQFRAMSRVARVLANDRLDRDREEEQVVGDESDDSDGFSPIDPDPSSEMPATFNNEIVKMAKNQSIELDSDDSVIEIETRRCETPQLSMEDVRNFYIAHYRNDPTVNIQNDHISENTIKKQYSNLILQQLAEEDKMLKTPKTPLRGSLRTLNIDNVGEGDSKIGNVTKGIVTNRSEEVFGL